MAIMAQEHSPDDVWLKVDEAAEYTRLAARTLRGYVYTGRLPASRIGSHQLRIRKSDLDALLRPVEPTQ